MAIMKLACFQSLRRKKSKHRRKKVGIRKVRHEASLKLTLRITDGRAELDARLLELYKNRNLQPSDPAGMYPYYIAAAHTS